MKKRLTQSEKLALRNAKANQNHRRALAADADLHEKVRRGEMTAAEALLSKLKK